MSGTRDKKSSSSLLLIAFGARNFLVNLLMPQARIRNRMGILYRIKVAKVRQITASQDKKGTLKFEVLGREKKVMEKYVNEKGIDFVEKLKNVLFNSFYERCYFANNVHDLIKMIQINQWSSIIISMHSIIPQWKSLELFVAFLLMTFSLPLYRRLHQIHFRQ